MPRSPLKELDLGHVPLTSEEFWDEVAACRLTATNLARSWTRCSNEAEDLVQRAVLRAYNRRELFIRGNPFRGWFLQVMRHVFLDELRRNRRRPASLSLDLLMENGMDYADPEHDSAGSAEHRLLQTEAEGHVHRILDQMPAHLSEVMRGVLGSEEGIHAVPASLGISTSVFRKRLLKARVILHRSMLAEQS